MIIIGFILDYLVMLLFPFNSYFIVYNLDKNKLFSVFLVSIIVDSIYSKVFFAIFILGLYFILKKLKIKEKYSFIKNIVLYLIFFNVGYFDGCSGNYIVMFLIGLLTYLIYLFFIRVYKRIV